MKGRHIKLLILTFSACLKKNLLHSPAQLFVNIISNKGFVHIRQVQLSGKETALLMRLCTSVANMTKYKLQKNVMFSNGSYIIII
jgi:hypothetical protein